MRLALAFAVSIYAAGAAAQERMTLPQCEESLSGLKTLMQYDAIIAPVTLDDEGWCQIENLEFTLDQTSKVRLASLQWRGSDMARFVSQGLPPRAFEVVGQGISVHASSGDEVFDYLFQVQTSRSQMGFGLNVRWDGVQNSVFVEQAYLDFDNRNRIEATARIDGIDLTNFVSIQMSAGSAGLRDLTVTSDFEGWFESFALMPLGQAILQRGDVPPEAQVATLKQQAIEMIGALPDGLMPSQSRDAVAAFVTELPNPRGAAQLQLSAQPPIRSGTFLPFIISGQALDLEQIVDVALNGVTILFTWTSNDGDEG